MKCSVYIATSLDGFIARPDGSIDWLQAVERAGEDYGYAKFHASIDTFIVGRKTYETALTFPEWPYAGKHCVVMSRSARSCRHGESFSSESPSALVARLARSGRQHAYVDGGNVIQQFLREGLIDELTLSLIPVLLGEGVRLFGPTGRDVPLTLASTRSFESGLVQLVFGVTGH